MMSTAAAPIIQICGSQALNLRFDLGAPNEQLRARVHHGPLSHQVIALADGEQLDIAAAGQIRLAVVTERRARRSPGLA